MPDVAANNIITANGSNTNIIITITQRTASSNMSLSAALSSVNTNSAIYLIGPTSASYIRYCFSYINFSSDNVSISV